MKVKILTMTLATMLLGFIAIENCNIHDSSRDVDFGECVFRSSTQIEVLGKKFAICVLKSMWLPAGAMITFGCLLASL